MDATVASTTERGAGDRAVPPGLRVNPSAWDQRLRRVRLAGGSLWPAF